MNKLFAKTMAALILVAAMGFSTNTASAQRSLRGLFHTPKIRLVTPVRTTFVIHNTVSPYKKTIFPHAEISSKSYPKSKTDKMELLPLRYSVWAFPVNIRTTDTTARRYQQQNPVRFGMSKALLSQPYNPLYLYMMRVASGDTVCIKNDY